MLLLLCFISFPPAFAGTPAARADAIPAAYRKMATQTAIPPMVLYALALTESGRSSAVGVRPWPWTLNIQGRSFFFGSRKLAWLKLKQAIAAHKTVDIGPMQVNWQAHKNKLGNAWQALDPWRNLRAGAQVLADCLARHRDLWRAVGCYHSGNERIAGPYRDRFGQRLLALMTP